MDNNHWLGQIIYQIARQSKSPYDTDEDSVKAAVKNLEHCCRHSNLDAAKQTKAQ